MIHHLAELGDLGQSRIPIGRDHRDAAIEGFEMLQDLSSVEAAKSRLERLVQGDQVVVIPRSAHRSRS
jgi:hypothetical protein